MRQSSFLSADNKSRCCFVVETIGLADLLTLFFVFFFTLPPLFASFSSCLLWPYFVRRTGHQVVQKNHCGVSRVRSKKLVK